MGANPMAPPPTLLNLVALQLLLLILATPPPAASYEQQEQNTNNQHLAQYNYQASSSSFGEPVFRLEPPSVINFASSRGATLLCLASGSPKPTISWYSSASSSASSSLSSLASDSFNGELLQHQRPVTNVTDLRQILHNGAALRLLPFNDTNFRHDIHSTEYRCVASNPLATIHSRSCLVQAVGEEPLEAKVGDEFVNLGSLAVFKCRPMLSNSATADLGHLLNWFTSDGLQIGAGETWPPQGASSKLVAFRTGELHVNQVEMGDLRRTYGCRWRNPITGKIASSSGLAQLILLSSDHDETGHHHQAAPNRPLVVHSASQVLAEENPTTQDNSILALPCALKQLQARDQPQWLYLAPNSQAFGRMPVPVQQLAWPSRQYRSHLALLKPQALQSGRYLCQIQEETVCDINVIISRPLKLSLHFLGSSLSLAASPTPTPAAAQQDFASNQMKNPQTQAQSQSQSQSQTQTQNHEAGWLSRALNWLEPAAEINQEDTSEITEERRPDPFGGRVGVSGPGYVRPPPLVLVGDRLELECRARGGPVEWVRWYRQGQLISAPSAGDFRVELEARAWPASAAGHLSVRQVQASLAGLQQFECEAGNQVGGRARAGLAVYVLERRQLEWARRQCPGPMNSTLEALEEAAEVDPSEAVFKRENPLKRALLLEGEPARLECPHPGTHTTNTNGSSAEWRRWTPSPRECPGASCQDTSGAAKQLNQLLGAGESPFVINGTSLQIRSPQRRHHQAAYLCRLVAHGGQTGRPEAAALGEYQSSSTASDKADGCRLTEREWPSMPEELEAAAARRQTPSISIRIVAKPKIEPFEFSRNLEEGMRAWAVCGVISGEPPVDITWFKDGQLLVADNEEVSISDQTSNQFSSTLTFHRIRPAHSGFYTCVAANAYASANHSSRLLVNVAPYFIEPPKNQKAVLGGQLLVDCRAGGQPRWRKLVAATSTALGPARLPLPVAPPNNQLQHNNKLDEFEEPAMGGHEVAPGQQQRMEFRIVTSNSHIQILENGSLLIKDAELGDASKYLCQASNGIQPALSELIEVQVLSPARFEVNYEAVSVKRDSMVKFNCAPRGDQPMRLEWRKESGLLLRSVHNSSSPMNDLAWKQSKYSELIHLAGDTQQQRHHSLLLVAQTPSNLTSDPSQQWEQQNQNQNQDQNQNLQPAISWSELMINYVERQDTGNFVCVARNAHGADRLTYRLIVQEQPDPPPQLQALQVHSTGLRLGWLAPFDGNLPLNHYVLEYRRIVTPAAAGSPLSGASQQQDPQGAEWTRLVVPAFGGTVAASSLESATSAAAANSSQGAWLRQLQPRASYQLRVAASNAMGQGQFGAPLTVTTQEEQPQQRPNDLRAQPVSSSSIKVMWRAPVSPPASSLDLEPAPVRGYYISHRRLTFNEPAQEPTQTAPSTAAGHWLGTVSLPATNISSPPPPPPSPNSQFPLGSIIAQPSLNYELILTGLEKNSRYEIRVQPYNLAGNGPAGETLGQTLRFDRPGQPRLRMVAARRQSLELRWSLRGDEPLLGFSLFYKTELDDWQEVQLAIVYQYLLDQLRCGSKYQLYLSAFNVVGRSDPSDVLVARTEGGAPVAPVDKSHFLLPNTSELVLDLGAWQSGGCPITNLMVQYKRLHEPDWVVWRGEQSSTRLTSGVPLQPDDRVTISDLQPATWYKLLVTAVNEADKTTAEYLVSTLDTQGRPAPAPAGANAVLLHHHNHHQEPRSLLQQLFGGLTGGGGRATPTASADPTLLPLASLLLLLLTCLAAYLYYARALAASSRHSSSSSGSSGASSGGGVRSAIGQSSAINQAGDEKQLIQASGHSMSAAMRLMLGSHQLPLDASNPTTINHQEQQQQQQQQQMWAVAAAAAAAGGQFGPAPPPSSSLSTRSTQCGANSQGSSSCPKASGMLQLVDESSLCQEPGDPNGQQLYYQRESPAHTTLYSATLNSAIPPPAPVSEELWAPSSSCNREEEQQQQLFAGAANTSHRLISSASFASSAELLHRQQANGSYQQQEPLYQRLESFQANAFGLPQLAGKAHTLKLGAHHHHHQLQQQLIQHQPDSQFKSMTLHRDSAALLAYPQQQQQHQEASSTFHHSQHFQQHHFLPAADCASDQQQHVMCLSSLANADQQLE